MTDPTKPLDAIERAQEETYFHKKDQELLEKLRTKLMREQAAEGIKAHTGVTDEALLARLAEIGITAETVPVLHLMPLLQVAWADGEIQPDERDLLLEAAHATGVNEGPAREALDAMLKTCPSAEHFAAALDFIRLMLAALPGDKADAARGNLEDLALRIADASGGIFGMFRKIDADERTALHEIAVKLTADKPGAT
ncbi:MAG: hypothetical protein KC620_14100, partial [Myxococcales bacterium]|nr:hypothetical protein [Myxococcales bacterium]